MEQDKISFLKNLITTHKERIKKSDDHNLVAKGIFENNEFYTWILEKFGSGYLRETKIEFQTDSKKSIIDQFQEWENEL